MLSSPPDTYFRCNAELRDLRYTTFTKAEQAIGAAIALQSGELCALTAHRGLKFIEYFSGACEFFLKPGPGALFNIALQNAIRVLTMDAHKSSIDEVVETTSAEQASQLGKQGWVMLAIGKGRDANGEACLKYSLGWKHPAEPAAETPPQSFAAFPGGQSPT